MAASPEVMAALKAGRGSPAGSAAPPGATPQPGPAAAGMMKPMVPKGSIDGAKADVFSAIKLLEKAASTLGLTSKEGQAVVSCVLKLTKDLELDPAKGKEQGPGEFAQIAAALAGPGKPPPGMPQMPPTANAPPQPIQ